MSVRQEFRKFFDRAGSPSAVLVSAIASAAKREGAFRPRRTRSLNNVNLPFIERAIVEEAKVVEYLLAADHPEGASKANFFGRCGFSVTTWRVLAEALIAQAHANPVSSASQSPFGMKYRVDGPIACPDGRTPAIRTVWIVENGTDFPRLVTAHPL